VNAVVLLFAFEPRTRFADARGWARSFFVLSFGILPAYYAA
jgi:hypothetical protein